MIQPAHFLAAQRAAVLVVALILAVPVPVTAQEGDESNLQRAARLISGGTRELIDTEIPMTPAEAEAFWAVYDRFDQEMDLLGAQYVRLVESYIDRFVYEAVDDAAAERFINEYLALQIGFLRVRQKYVDDFRGAIGSVRTMRLYQLQNQVRIEVERALIDVVPLVEGS